MQQFNINTLVRVKSNSDATLINSGRAVEFTGKVVGLHPRNGICVHPFDGNPIEGAWYLPEELTLWQPQKGEWVIPNTKTTESFSVFRYTENYKGFKLQPFIGELPSFLKENNDLHNLP